MKKILLPHPDRKSRPVEEGDIPTVLKDCMDLARVCFEPIGGHVNGAIAMAHVQVEAKDPLRFFVKRDGKIIINPVIVSTKQSYMHNEGCMSFPDKGVKPVPRFNIIEVKHSSAKIGDKKIDLENPVIKKFSGMDAAIIQHEIGHFDLKLIF